MDQISSDFPHIFFRIFFLPAQRGYRRPPSVALPTHVSTLRKRRYWVFFFRLSMTPVIITFHHQPVIDLLPWRPGHAGPTILPPPSQRRAATRQVPQQQADATANARVAANHRPPLWFCLYSQLSATCQIWNPRRPPPQCLFRQS